MHDFYCVQPVQGAYPATRVNKFLHLFDSVCDVNNMSVLWCCKMIVEHSTIILKLLSAQ